MLEVEITALPFRAPASPFNQAVSFERGIEILDLPLNKLRKIGETAGGTINDALLAVCGGGLRSYLIGQGSLPDHSLLAGIPVVRNGEEGRRLNTLVCDLYTVEDNAAHRLQGIVETTHQLKQERHPDTGKLNYINMVLMPALVMTLLGLGTKVPVPFNLVVSNAPGSRPPPVPGGSTAGSSLPLVHGCRRPGPQYHRV